MFVIDPDTLQYCTVLYQYSTVQCLSITTICDSDLDTIDSDLDTISVMTEQIILEMLENWIPSAPPHNIFHQPPKTIEGSQTHQNAFSNKKLYICIVLCCIMLHCIVLHCIVSFLC